MGLFSIFKKKKEEPEAVTTPSDGIKVLADGILFEEEGVFLKWGVDIETGKLYLKKEYRADRTIYQWGEKTILNGLKLPFKTVCWNHKQHGDTKSLESVEFLTEGGDAEDQFRSIKKHIEKTLGEPKQYADPESGDIALEWRVKAVKVALNLYNKEQVKIKFEIGWWV